jgi:uncharacterized protein YndB with AHSA1/START domain
MTKTLELKKVMDAPANVVFEAIAQGQLLRSTAIIERTFKHTFKVGGEYFLNWQSKPQASCSGRYVEIVPNKLVKFTWNSKDCSGSTPSETTVTVHLKEHGGKCDLTLIHEGLPAGVCHDEHLKGWTYTLERLPGDVVAVHAAH